MALAVGDLAIVKTAAGLNARTSPSGPLAKSGGQNVVRPKGFKFKVEKLVNTGGHTWARGKGWWYRADFLGKYAKPVAVTVASPVPGYGCNYSFGVRNSRYAAGYHTGADFAAPTGSRIVAVTGGKITRTDWGGAYGNWTWLKSANGRTYVYCHQKSRAVSLGQTVKAGQTIGYVNSTGNVTGPHLHLEVTRPGETWAYGRTVNPIGTW